MEEKKLLFNIGPIWFDGTIVLMVLLTCIIVFAFVYACTRNMKLRPKGKQTVIEWLVDFIRGIITDNLPRKEVSNFHLMAFTLFMFVLVSNILGLVTKSLWATISAFGKVNRRSNRNLNVSDDDDCLNTLLWYETLWF